MKKLTATWIAISLLTLLPTGCQQLMLQQAQKEYNQKHEAYCLRKYSEHVEKQQNAIPRMQERLSSATQAEWRWMYDCDACDETLIPANVKLSRAEFEKVVSLLKLATPMPPLPQEVFMSEAPKLALDSDGQILRPINIEPRMGCCGGVSPMLVFLDSEGNECLYWDFYMAAPTSRIQEYLQKKDDIFHPEMQLTDAAYEQLRNLPSAIQVRQTDEAFQRKLKHLH